MTRPALLEMQDLQLHSLLAAVLRARAMFQDTYTDIAEWFTDRALDVIAELDRRAATEQRREP